MEGKKYNDHSGYAFLKWKHFKKVLNSLMMEKNSDDISLRRWVNLYEYYLPGVSKMTNGF